MLKRFEPYKKYLSYLLRHKWYVYKAGRRLRAPFFRLLIHDWSKFTPSEFFPYVDYFYRKGGEQAHRDNSGHYDPTAGPIKFNIAWLKHQHRNAHHWQHWTLREDSGATKALPIPEKFIREMVADWIGAGAAQMTEAKTASRFEWKFRYPDTRGWYNMNKNILVLHPDTRLRVERLIFEEYLMRRAHFASHLQKLRKQNFKT